MVIVFEGIDGAGKGTQSYKLSSRLNSEGISNALFSFPNYTGTFFGGEVGKYLDGFYGPFDSMPAKFPAMLYALDRFEMKAEILSACEEGRAIIFDRYVPSNYMYQSAKIPESERSQFIDWVKRLEYNILGMPKPDVTVFLDVPAGIASKYVLKKKPRSYTAEKTDAHEKDVDYLEKVYELYKKTAEKEDWLIIPCVGGDDMLPQDEIFSLVLKGVKERI